MKNIYFRTIMLKGEAGGTISRIELTSSTGRVDTYTIYLNDGTTTTFEVTNGNGIVSVEKSATAGLVDTYTITFDNGDTTTFDVTNGEDSPSYEVPTDAVVYWNSEDPIPEGYEASSNPNQALFDSKQDRVEGGSLTDANTTYNLNDYGGSNKNYWVNLARCTNAPASTGYGVLEVIKFISSSSACLQRFTKFGTGTDSTRGDTFIRYFTNNQWYAWQKITALIS